MKLEPVALELIAQNVMEALPLKEGQFLHARILEIRDDLLLLMLNSKTVISSRLMADLELRQGQEIVLQIKDVKDGRIELSVASGQGRGQRNVISIPGEYNVEINQESIPIVKELVENGLTVTAKSLEDVQRAIKHITYLLNNMALIDQHPVPLQRDVMNAPLDQIVKWLVITKEDKEKGYIPIEKTFEQEKLLILMKELTGVTAEDIVKLRKFGLELSPYNLILAKNLKENKGFLEILLKVFYESGDRGKNGNNQCPRETPPSTQNTENGIKLNPKGNLGRRDTADHTKLEIKPLDIAGLLGRVAGQGKASSKLRAAAEILTQRTVFLNKAMASQEYSIFPFLFDGQVSECLIRSHRERVRKQEQWDDVLELEIDTQLPHLGRIKACIRARDKDIDCSFFVEAENIAALIENNKRMLSIGIEKAGFRVTRISCQRLANTAQRTADKFIDLKV